VSAYDGVTAREQHHLAENIAVHVNELEDELVCGPRFVHSEKYCLNGH
jgi:hypothetical protein